MTNRKGGGPAVWLLPKNGPCAYCGDTAGTKEHVIPWRFIRGTGRTQWLVPACGECNSLLSTCDETTLCDRAAELLMRLEVRYKKLLSSPRWTDKEIEDSELDGGLLKHVLAQRAIRDMVEERLTHLEMVIQRECEEEAG